LAADGQPCKRVLRDGGPRDLHVDRNDTELGTTITEGN
jgi:hypothetical protein